MARPSNYGSNFDERILIRLRIKKGLSKQELSVQTCLEYTTLTRIESGLVKNPSFKTVSILAKFFDVPMETFAASNI